MSGPDGDLTVRPALKADLPTLVGMLADDELGATRERLDDPLPEELFPLERPSREFLPFDELPLLFLSWPICESWSIPWMSSVGTGRSWCWKALAPKPRPKLFEMFKLYGSCLYFYCCEISRANIIDDVETKLINTFVPHINSAIPIAKLSPELKNLYE